MIKVYLACPFSHSDPKVRAYRAKMADKMASKLMMQGYLVFSPLSHSVPISKYTDVDPCDHDFWLRQDLWILDVCDEFHILCIDGWHDSHGLKVELERAKEKGLKIYYHIPKKDTYGTFSKENQGNKRIK